MRRLYLVQHGKATSKDENPDRPLTESGRAEVEAVARHLASRGGVKPASVLHSGKTRARETAEMLAGALGVSGAVEEAEGLGPTDAVRPWVREMGDREGDLMLVGHLPFMSRMAGTLVAGNRDRVVHDFQNAGVVCLIRDEEQRWMFGWILTPELVV